MYQIAGGEGAGLPFRCGNSEAGHLRTRRVQLLRKGRVEGAVLIGKTWSIPKTAQKPERLNKRDDTPKDLQ